MVSISLLRKDSNRLFVPFCSRTSSSDTKNDLVDNFVNYIGERIRKEDDRVKQLCVLNEIHRVLFDFEMNLAKVKSQDSSCNQS